MHRLDCLLHSTGLIQLAAAEKYTSLVGVVKLRKIKTNQASQWTDMVVQDDQI